MARYVAKAWADSLRHGVRRLILEGWADPIALFIGIMMNISITVFVLSSLHISTRVRMLKLLHSDNLLDIHCQCRSQQLAINL